VLKRLSISAPLFSYLPILLADAVSAPLELAYETFTEIGAVVAAR
jgi:hypothetical protein